MNVSSKTCLITGANSGLGLATTKRFAKLGANVILLCRDKEKGESAVFEVKKEVPNASLELMICDLASMKSVQSFIHRFKENHSKLDILFNNAAVMKQKRSVTENGFETMFQVNYLAPFMLATSLLDPLKSSSSAQIINIAVPSDKLRLDFEDLQFSRSYKAFSAFFKTKLCLLFSSLELSRRLEGTGIKVTIADPGSFKSNLVREAPWPFGWIKNLFSGSVDRAADNIIFLATSDEVRATSGKIFVKKQERPLTPYWSDTSISERLWSVTESLIDNPRNSVQER